LFIGIKYAKWMNGIYREKKTARHHTVAPSDLTAGDFRLRFFAALPPLVSFSDMSVSQTITCRESEVGLVEEDAFLLLDGIEQERTDPLKGTNSRPSGCRPRMKARA